jgi:hypothetical protein
MWTRLVLRCWRVVRMKLAASSKSCHLHQPNTELQRFFPRISIDPGRKGKAKRHPVFLACLIQKLVALTASFQDIVLAAGSNR